MGFNSLQEFKLCETSLNQILGPHATNDQDLWKWLRDTLPFLDFQCILPRNQAMPSCWCKLRIYNIWIKFRCDLRPVEDATGLWHVKIIFSMAHTSKNIYQPRQHTISPRIMRMSGIQRWANMGIPTTNQHGFSPCKKHDLWRFHPQNQENNMDLTHKKCRFHRFTSKTYTHEKLSPKVGL